MFSFEGFTDALHKAGWRSVCDAQHTEVVSVYDEMVSESRKAEQIKSLRARVRELEGAIDNKMVVSHLGVFNPGDDPKVALNKLQCYSQDVGAYFAHEENQQLRDALVRAREATALSSSGFCKKTAEILDAAINITISGHTAVDPRDKVIE